MYEIKEPDELRMMIVDAVLQQKLPQDELTIDEFIWMQNKAMEARILIMNDKGHPMAFTEEECPSIH